MDKKDDRKSLRDLSEECRIGLTERLPRFRDLTEYGFAFKDYCLEKRLLTVDTSEFLKSKKFKLHKNCYSRYNKDVLQRAESKRRKLVTTNEEEQLPSSSGVSTRATTGSISRPLGSLICVFCEKGENVDPKNKSRLSGTKLRAAGNLKIGADDNVNAFTEKLRTQAVKLGDSKILSKLLTDVRASEIFYHTACLSEFNNRYNRALKSEDATSTLSVPKDDFAIYAALEALREYIQTSDTNKFTFRDLRTVWSSRCQEIGASDESSHVTRFVPFLEEHQDLLGICVWQESEGSHYQFIRKSTFKAALKSSEYCEQLRNVAESIREEIFALQPPDPDVFM